jgi:hypothetical protein
MRGEWLELNSIIDAGELRSALESLLASHFARTVGIARLDRRVSQYCSSFVLEELDLTLDDGTALALMLKDLSPASRFGGAVKVKPDFIYDPEREIRAYERILARHRIGTATCYGAVVEPERARYWLLLERLAPVHLWQQGEFETWTRAAAWLAEMHARFRQSAPDGDAAHLIRYDRAFYWRWMERAERFVAEGDRTKDRVAAQAVRWLAARYERAVERLCMLPHTVIHGEFFASNVLVDPEAPAFRICPVDWEVAAVGPGMVDVAGLTAGRWTREQKDAMALAYFDAMPAAGLPQPTSADFLGAVECCRLHQAVQMLGWAPGWEPVPEHAQDWLGEAMEAARRLGL